MRKYSYDEIIQWKVIRTLSSFPNKKFELILLDILKISKKPELKWEADRNSSSIRNKLLMKGNKRYFFAEF